MHLTENAFSPSRQAFEGLGRLPNFLIIGAAKGGTTSVWQQLSQHPAVYMHPDKRLEYFSFESDRIFAGPPPLNASREPVSTIHQYKAAFVASRGATAVGEASNTYLYSEAAASRVHDEIPDVRIIAILRNPAERAFSRYLQLRRSGRETETFSVALAREDQRIRENWWPEFHYVAGGLYHRQLSRYYSLFPAHQIRIYLFEQLVSDMRLVLGDMFRFLGVDDSFDPPDKAVYSASGLVRSKAIHGGLKVLRAARPIVAKALPSKPRQFVLRVAAAINNRNLVKPPLPAKDRAYMIEKYRDDTLRLQDLLNVDLCKWLDRKN
jgi:hypothetical protein